MVLIPPGNEVFWGFPLFSPVNVKVVTTSYFLDAIALQEQSDNSLFVGQSVTQLNFHSVGVF